MNVGVVLAGVLTTALVEVGASDVLHGAGGRRPHVLDAELVEAGEHGVPVVDLKGEVAGWNRGRLRPFGEVDLAGAEAQLELTSVERRSPVQELGAEDFRVPIAGALAVTDLDVDVVDQLGPEHGRDLPADESSSAWSSPVKPPASGACPSPAGAPGTPPAGKASSGRESATCCGAPQRATALKAVLRQNS